MPSSSSSSSMLPLLSFRGLPLRSSRFSAPSSVRRHTNSSAAFTASSIASSSCASGDSAVMFRRSRRRFFRTDSRSSDGRSRKKCCSSRMVAIALMPLLPITVFLLTLFLLPVKQAKRQEPLIRPIPEDPLIRLPTDVVPVHYELHLKVYLPYRKGIDFGERNWTVDGNLRLHLLCRQATNVLLLHAKGLNVDHEKTAVWDEGRVGTAGPRVIGSMELAGRNDLLELRLDRALLPGRTYILEMSYRAAIQKSSTEGGLFLSGYKTENGEQHYLAATQMQPLDARRLLPCFDEPSFKAEFSLSVQHPEGTNVLSNAPIEHSRSVERGWTLSLFERTPKMATYLLALCVSDFQHKETMYKGVKIRVWAQPSKLPYTAHALDVSSRIMHYFEDYFDIPYPLKKLDIVGVPSLRVTAMENWGLILCRQQNFVYTEGIHAKRDRQFVTDVLAHEIAHMWFGDLVTMEWWDDLWLNEGFATIMGMKAADYAENTTSRTSQLFFEHTVKAFLYDQVPSHALSYKISSVREVARRFDRITYLKAAAVLRMVERTVGEHLFMEGLRAFLRQFQYRNARSDDLLSSLSMVETNGKRRALSLVNFSLSDFMDSWTYQTGFPLIRINPLNGTAVMASQEQFFYLQKPIPNPSLWKVPLFMEVNGSKENVWLLERENAVLPRSHIVDPQAHGYYRIQYDAETYQQIICTLNKNFSAIPVASRARLLEDSFTLARVGLYSYNQVLELSEYLMNETEYLPLLVFNNHVQLSYLMLRNHPRASMLKDYIVQILEPMFQHVFSTQFLQANLSDTMREFAMVQLCHFEYAPCVNHSLQEFTKMKAACHDKKLSDPTCNTIPPELRSPIYSTAIRHGSDADFEFLREKYRIEEYDSERGRILSGLASTANLRMVNLILNDLINKKPAPAQDEFYNFLIKFVKSPILNDIVLYMKTNFRAFAKKLHSPLIIKVVLTFVTKWMQTERDLDELAKFERDYRKELTEFRLLDWFQEQAETIRSNMEFVRTLAPDIFEYLNERQDSGRSSKNGGKCQPLMR